MKNIIWSVKNENIIEYKEIKSNLVEYRIDRLEKSDEKQEFINQVKGKL